MDHFFDKNGFFASPSSLSTLHVTPTPPPSLSSSPPPAYSASVKRSSFFTVTANEFLRSPSPLFDRTSRTLFDVQHRSETPHSLFKMKFSDSSSGYGSGNSFSSSAFHTLRRTPSVSHFSNTSDPLYTTSTTLDRKRPPVKEKPTKAQLVRNSITNMLDQIDRRVAFLKETASELELEKKKLQKVLNSIVTCDELSAIAEVEQEEIKVTTKGLIHRLNSVDVIITTPRDQSQQKALESVNLFIEQLLTNAKHSKDAAIAKCLSYLSACSSDSIKDSPQSPPDEKFQKMIIECAVDDQKMIRKTLQQIISDLSK